MAVKKAITKVDWNKEIQPLLKKYKGKKHPLDYKNIYELLVMVILSAQVTDKLINDIAPELFKAYPTMESMSRATVNDLRPYIGKVRSFFKKADWLIRISQQLKEEKNIPLTMEELVKLPGIGIHFANVVQHHRIAMLIADLFKNPQRFIIEF